jgi:hypothetical protein
MGGVLTRKESMRDGGAVFLSAVELDVVGFEINIMSNWKIYTFTSST